MIRCLGRASAPYPDGDQVLASWGIPRASGLDLQVYPVVTTALLVVGGVRVSCRPGALFGRRLPPH
jgi:hypothetical protein